LVFKSIQLKISVVVLFLILIFSGIVFVSIYFNISIPIIILICTLTIVFFFFLFFLITKILVVDKIHLIEQGIDKITMGEDFEFINIDSKDEFHDLADRINKMTKIVNDRNLEKRESLIAETIGIENEKYLSNINDGLLFIDYGQIISEYYSRSLVDIFDRQEIGGQHLSDFIYPDKIEQKEKRTVLEKFIMGLFQDPSLFDSISEMNNPLHDVWVSRDDGMRILVDGIYRKVEDKGQLVQIMIIFKDKTDQGILEKKIDEKDMRSDFELDTIVSILRAGPGPFLQFIKECDLVLTEFRANIIELETESVLHRSFRNIHSMECSAAYFDFKAVEKLSRNLEDILSGFRLGNFARKEALDIILDDLYDQFEHVKHLIIRFQEFLSSDDGLVFETNKNEQEHFFDTLKIMSTRNADSLGKVIELFIDCDFTDFSLLNVMKTPIIHLLRNAVDHGIENPEERISSGKTERGIISLLIKENADKSVKIIVEDDGRGIDFIRLRDLAIKKGFIRKDEQPGHGNLIRTLFKSGFSYSDEPSGYSGRGVGLDAVKEDVTKAGGKITIKTDRYKGSRFTILLPPDIF
jgi:two-component system chemotaxis sensor kinase CheA